MSKKLTAAAINKQNNKLNAKKSLVVLGEYEVNIDKQFRDSKIDKVVFDYLNIIEEAKRNQEIDEDFIRGSLAIFNLLILREFSDVPGIPSEKNSKELIRVTETLYDIGIMEEVLQGFDQEQLQKAFQRLEAASKRTDQIIAEYAIASTLGNGDDSTEDGEQS